MPIHLTNHAFSTVSTTGTQVLYTQNTHGVTLAVPPYVTAASGGTGGDGYNIIGVNGTSVGSAATIQFSNSNNVSFGLNASTITASASYPAQTAYQFSNSNGVSFGTNGSTVTATVATNYAASNITTNNIATANSSLFQHTSATSAITSNAFPTANSTNLLGTGYTTHTHTYRASNDGIGLNSALTANGVSVTANSSGLSLNFPAFLTTAAATNVTTNNMATAERNNYFYTSNNTFANSTHTHGMATVATNGSNVTVSSNSGGYTLAVPPFLTAAAGGGDGYNIVQLGTAGTTGTAWSSLSGTVQLNGAGNITVSQNNSNQLVVSGPSYGTSLNLTNLTGTLANNSNGIALSLQAAAPGGGAGVTLSTYVPYYPASTGAQTLGAQGVTSASAFYWPISIVQAVKFNRIEQLMTVSNVSSATAASGGQTISHHFGLFSNNAGTLSLISSSSFSICVTCNSGSASLSFPNAYGTAGGYTWVTTAATGSAQAQSLWGTAGNRIVTFGFGNTMSLSEGVYFLGLHQRQTTAGFNVGINCALAGNVMVAAQNAGPLGSYTTAWTGTGVFKWPWGIATSTGSANYGGTKLPDSMAVSAISKTMTNMPMCTFISR